MRMVRTSERDCKEDSAPKREVRKSLGCSSEGNKVNM